MTGWVKNLHDGSVKAVVEGEKEKIRDLISWANRGPSRARVDEVNVDWEEAKGEFENFSIRY